jgi:TPR repeat protein
VNSQHVNEVAGDIFKSAQIAGPDVVYLAVPLFRLSALKGNVNAKYAYAQFLRTGQGVPSDPCEAVALFTELSKQGHPYAQLALGSMYSSGLGVDVNLEKAVELYEVQQSYWLIVVWAGNLFQISQ